LTFILWIAASLVIIQLIYWILFYFALSGEIKPGTALNIPLSVIVCAHDEEDNLRELVPILLSQNHSAFEVIIVNDRSNDGTYDYLLTETRKNPHLKMVHVNYKPDHMNGKKYGLTLGIKAAQYDWILLTDADCRPASTEWIRQMAGGFTENASLVLGYSPYIHEPGLLNAFIRFETMLTGIQYFSFARMGLPYMGVGRNLAYRKKLFLDNKGFHGHMAVMGGDDDLFVNQHATKQNAFTVLNEKAVTYSKPKTTWAEYYQQKIRHLAVGKHYQWKHKLVLAPLSISNILLWPSVIPCLFTVYWDIALLAILARWIIQILTALQLTKKSGERLEIRKIPVLDFIFCFYYLVAGFRALFTKRIQWKT
jgi:cellulose synthase/poly-beta-1,6-N-acetylglucosamine synthase-like glycosyltransferase